MSLPMPKSTVDRNRAGIQKGEKRGDFVGVLKRRYCTIGSVFDSIMNTEEVRTISSVSRDSESARNPVSRSNPEAGDRSSRGRELHPDFG